ncbi:MAG TPA: HAD family phosphatase [Streptosporangiaceae bacterium]|nr:HAD family phosphatase [Streptosporangiaceae bacterium]
MRPPKPRPGAVLFDMDGLLVDSEPLWFEVERSVMARLGGTWGEEDQRALLGGSLDRSVTYMLMKATEGNGARPGRTAGPDEVGRWLVEGMAEEIARKGLPLQPGASGLLAAVADAGLPHALVTSSQRLIMDAVLAATSVKFPVTVCGEDVEHGKPAPDPYLRAATLLGAGPATCVALEDSPSGIAAAQAAGCAVIAVPTIPIPPTPGLVIVGSLREVDLDMLASVTPAT